MDIPARRYDLRGMPPEDSARNPLVQGEYSSVKNPYQKKYHMGGKIRQDGAVSALCFDPPRPINLAKERRTIVPSAVTCPHCRKLMADRSSIGEPAP